MIPDSYLETIKAHGMEMDEGFPIPAWKVEEHLKFMDEAGIRTSVLTMPAPQPYFGDGAQSAVICRRFNEEAAMLKALHPDRFLFCAALPLPDVDRALQEAKYAREVLGADGVKLATNSFGQYLGDPELEPLMVYLDSRKAVIITHPHKPSSVNDKLIASVPLASYEYLAETTRAILNMVAHDVLVRYPDLKVVVPHCGSFLPNALPRFKGLLPVMVKQGYMQPVDVDANISHLYFDLGKDQQEDLQPVDTDDQRQSQRHSCSCRKTPNHAFRHPILIVWFHFNPSDCFFSDRSARRMARMATGIVKISTLMSTGILSITGIINWS